MPLERESSPEPAAPPQGWRERSTAPRSGPARRRSLQRATAFVDAALGLLEETLASDFTIRQVFERAGLSRRAFYELFGGKDDLLVATYEETIRRLIGDLEGNLAGTGDPVERLHAIVDRLFLGSASDARVRHAALMTREYMRLARLRPEAMRAAIDPALSLLRRELERAMEAGVVRRGDAFVLAMMLFNVGVSHIPTRLLDAGAGTGPTITASDHWEFCRRALGIEA